MLVVEMGKNMKKSITHEKLFHGREILRSLNLLMEPGQVFEARLLKASTRSDLRYSGTVSGYFNRPEAFIEALRAEPIYGMSAAYITLNAVQPDLLARANNRLRYGQEMRDAASTSDSYIARLRWIMLDIDPTRVSGVSSNQAEHAAALKTAWEMRVFFQDVGLPDVVVADSGNGAHVLVPIDLPVEEGTKETGLVYRVLKAFAQHFDTPDLKIDQSVYNPARICKLYGTLVCKGDNTAERPHRFARLLHVPAELTLFTREQLESIAFPRSNRDMINQPRQVTGKYKPFLKKPDPDWLVKWIDCYQPDVQQPKAGQDRTTWIFNQCPFSSEHKHGAVLQQFADGGISASCRHDSCRGKNWHMLRRMYELNQQKCS